MKPFKFCPACASALEGPDAEGGSRCPSCDRSWYVNAAPTAGAVIVDRGRALITCRARDPEAGRYDVPGGFLKADEDPLTGLKRELREELGIEIEAGSEDYVQAVPHRYGDEGNWTLAMGFTARIVSGQPIPADDVASVKWVTLAELDDVDFAWEHDRDLVRKALSHG